MRRPKLSFKDKPVAEQLNLARRVANSIAGDAALAARVTRLGQLQAVLAETDAAVLALALAHTAWKTELTRRNEALRRLRLVTRSAMQELLALGAGETELLAAGLELSRPRAPIGVLPAPVNVRAQGGAFEGSIKLTWDPLRVRRPVYQLQIRDVPNGAWRMLEVKLRRQHVVRGLVSGRLYEFRVAGAGAAGLGAWSQAARARAT
jgi:hypothetical protein